MKVSVVIPTHNRSKLVKRAIDSVLRQTYQNFEIIVVSDGSTDDTDFVLKEISKNDPRVKFIAYENAKGANYARNIGIKEAAGDFVAFLDDDDEWMPEKLELQMNKFKENELLGLVYTGVEVIYYTNKKIINYYSIPKKTGNLSRDILISNCIGTTSSVVMKKSLFSKIGLFDENLKARQDYDLWIRACQITEVGAVNKPLVRYYNSTTTKQISDDVQKYEDALMYLKRKYEKYYNNLDESLLRRHKQANYMLLALKCLRNGNPKIARRYILKHFKLKPSFRTLFLYLLSYFDYDLLLRLRARMN